MNKFIIKHLMRKSAALMAKTALFLATLFLVNVSLVAMEVANKLNNREKHERIESAEISSAGQSFKELLKLFLSDEKKYNEHVCTLPKDMKFLMARELLHNNSIIQLIGKRLSIQGKQIAGDLDKLKSIELNDAGNRVISIAGKQKAHIWNLELDGYTTISTDDYVQVLAFNGLGNMIAIANLNNSIRITNTENGDYLSLGGVSRHAKVQFNFSGDKFIIFNVLNDFAPILGDVVTGGLQKLEGHQEFVNSVRFNRLGTKIVTASSDGTAKIWDSKTGVCLQTLKGHSKKYVFSATFNDLGDKVATVSEDNTAKIWDVETGVCLQTLNGHTNELNTACFNNLGTKIVTASSDGTAKIWDVETGVCLQTLTGHSDWVGSAEFNARSNRVITSSGDKTVKIWNAVTGACLLTLGNNGETIMAARFNDLGDKALITSADVTASIYDLSPLEEVMDWLERSCTLEQALLLNFINKTAFVRAVFKKRKSSETFRFDFNKCKHLQKHFDSMPEALKKSFKSYVIQHGEAGNELA